ncbi:MAG: isoaspartyl peptidase/L-asparaginase [Candidatus Thorarchaeota archaeon]|nr:isoaspartyl peptidase/L-asparaginase [Candidatus Thorarchaeota archaeon]
MKLPIVVVHGGATVFEKKHHDAILKAVKEAAEKGMCAFEKGGSALDAVEAAIWVLEETNLFTAGLGASKNLDGAIELDALIMDGNRLESGAVMAVRDIVHPISLARYVLERTSNSQIVGSGANKLYEQMLAEGYREGTSSKRTEGPFIAQNCDTVGAIAIDETGRIASAASTSGWPGKLPGRVGDSPIVGAGVYANDIAGASCTGKGEQILRITMGRMAVFHVEQGLSVQQAAETVMSELRQKTSGEAGLILADKLGNLAIQFDTPHMPVAVLSSDMEYVYCSMTPVWSIDQD